MAALIVDPALHSMGGHHFNAIVRLQSEFAQRGIEYRTLGSAHANLDVTNGLAVTPVFSRSVYSRTDWNYPEFMEAARETRRQLSAALRWRWTGPDVVVLPCCDQVLALALARHLRARRYRCSPHILMWLMYAPHYKKALDDPETADLTLEYKQAMAELAAAISDAGKITICCETDGMAGFYGNLTGLSIDVVPGPNLIRRSGTRDERASSGEITVICIGQANRPKGYRLLPDALRRVLAARRDVRFLIHGTVAGTDSESDISIFQELTTLGPRVSVNTEVLGQAEYKDWLERGDLILLPYDPAIYRTRGSGVFTEASTLGIPTVVPQGCEFASAAFAEGRAVEITDYNAQGVADSLLLAVEQISQLKARARAVAEALNHDLRLQALLDRIL